MHFLADESCDFSVVRALRAAGYDVLAVSEITPSAEDAEVIRLAAAQGRIVLTEDRDFGRLVYAHGEKTLGVIYIRFPASARKQLPKIVVALVKRYAQRLTGEFVVVEPGRVRITHPPGD